ncbi:MAG: hypothetical protein KDC98_26325, partial [Planctomycetes bacterium]|nr:hypothetical protein [Planctomycetota bacterium]
MRHLLASLTFIPAILPAQGVVPPLENGQIYSLTGLSSSGMPAASVGFVHMIHLPGDPANVFYCSACVQGLSPAYGGAGGDDIVCGSYDVLTDLFTPNLEAAALNTYEGEGGLMLHHSGLYAVFDRVARHVTGSAWLAGRSAIGQPWHIIGEIGGPAVPGWPAIYPALADHHGHIQLLYTDWNTRNIVMAPLNLSFPWSPGPPVTIVVPPASSSFIAAVQPIPVTDPNGELIGVSHSVLTLPFYADSDHYVSLDLDPGTPALLTHDTPGMTYAGAFVGGRFFDGEWPPLVGAAPLMSAREAIWFTGGRAPVGGMMHVRLFTPPTTETEVYVSLFAIGPAFWSTGVPVPGMQGLLGIDPAGAWASDLVLHDNDNGEALISFPVPNPTSAVAGQVGLETNDLGHLVGTTRRRPGGPWGLRAAAA